MSYGSYAIEPVGARRVLPVPPTAASPRVGARMEGGARGGGAVATSEQPRPAAAELPVLSATSLRAQAVTGLLEARRSDLVGADRALSEPAAAAQRSLADVWPRTEPDRPDARVAQELRLAEAATAEAAQRRRDRQERREDQLRADAIAAQDGAGAPRPGAAPEAPQEQPGTDPVAATRREMRLARARAAEDAGLLVGAGDDQRETSRARRAAATRADAAEAAREAAGGEAAVREAAAREVAAERAADLTQARGLVVRAAEDVRRLAEALAGVRAGVREGVERGVGDVNDLAQRVAGSNARLEEAAREGAPAPREEVRQRDQLVVALARLSGATAQPGAGGRSGTGGAVDVLIDGRALVTGGETASLVAVPGPEGDTRVAFADGRGVSLSSGVLASRLGTLNRMLPALDAAATSVLTHLAEQALDPGTPVPGGPESALALSGLVRELAGAAESSAAYAQVAASVEDLVSRLDHGDVPSAARGSDMLIGAIGSPAPAPESVASAAAALPALRAALSDLGHLARGAAPGLAATTSLVSGAPGIATPTAAPDAPTGTATLRVLSLASGGVVASAQSFHPDSPLGDGRETTVGIVTGLGTPQETTTVVDVGRYPTPADLVSAINQSAAGVHASLSQLTGGTVQLRLEALETGRGTDITILNGSQPPAASAVIGRAVTLTAARDTVVEVQRAGRAATLVHTAETALKGVLPGLDVQLHRADPSRAFAVGVRRDASAAVDLTARLVDQAGTAMGAATAAGAPETAAALAGALGLGVGASATARPGDGADGAERGERRVPGVGLDRRGNPQLDRGVLATAFAADPADTQARVTAMARGLSQVAANGDAATWEAYAAARAAAGAGQLETYAPPDARKATRDEHVTTDLTRQERALMAVLAKLQDQGDWLGRQLAGAPEAAVTR